MPIVCEPFGTTAAGEPVERYTLEGPGGLRAAVLTYGGIVTELWASDAAGRLRDVVLGFDNLRQYETESPYFGCIIGRVAFRIAGAAFSLDGRDYRLTPNQGEHHLHGGAQSFSRVVWRAEARDGAEPALRLRYRSRDREEGYPGNVDAEVTYTLVAPATLRIDFVATTDQPTPLNMTHHGYFNLGGAEGGDVLGHVLTLNADRYAEGDEKAVPTGRLLPVAGTPLDFTTPQAIGARIAAAGGYDLGYLLARHDGRLQTAATVVEPTCGRRMEVRTTEPAIIFYSGNALTGSLVGKRAKRYPQHAGLCLETGRLPDAVHRPHFPTVIVRPGEVYSHRCEYAFGSC